MKKSEWFKALLFAEEMHQKGYVFERSSGNEFDRHTTWIRWKKDNTQYSIPVYSVYAREHVQGTLDYQEHLKRLEGLK